MREFYKQNKVLIDKIVFLTLSIVFIFIFMKYLMSYILPFVIGYVISLLINPFVDYLHKRHKINRGISAFFLLLICIMGLVVGGTALVGRIAREVNVFTGKIPMYTEQLQGFVDSIRLKAEDLLLFIPEDLSISPDGIFTDISVALAGFLGSMLKQGSVNIVSVVPNALMTLVLAIVSAFFFIKDKKLIKSAIITNSPLWLTGNFAVLRSGLSVALNGYIKAQLILMTIISSICILGLTIIGNPYAILFGIGLGVFDFLPVFGIGAILWPWAAISFIAGNHTQGILLLVIYGVCFLVRQFLEPKIVGEQIGIHPLPTLMSVYIGLKIFGFAGLIIGPIIVIVAKVIISRTDENGAETEPQVE